MTTHLSVPFPHEVISHGSVMRSDSTNSQRRQWRLTHLLFRCLLTGQ